MTSFASPATESLSENRTGLFLNQMPGFAGVEGGLNAGLHRVYKTFSYDFAPGSLVVPKKSGYVDLTDARGKRHILEGDATGGGHRFGTGQPGKSEFPSNWSDEKILHEISDIATDPSSTFRLGRGGRTIAEGTRDGVDIRVVIENPNRGERIVTGFPTNAPRNPR